MPSFPNQVAEQGIIGTGETQVDHLSVRVECRRERARQRKRIAARGVRIGVRLPTGFEYQEPRVRRDADDALAIVGDGGDHAGHFSAMPIAPKLRVIGIDEVDRGGNAGAQIRMLGIDARIDDRNLDALAPRPGMRIGDVHLLKAALQPDVGVVVVVGAGCKGLQGLRQLDAPILRQRGEQLIAIGARRVSPARRNGYAAVRSATRSLPSIRTAFSTARMVSRAWAVAP